MGEYDSKINELLVYIFDKILLTEEKALQVGTFADLTISEMHTLEAIGLYESRTMSETAKDLSITTGTLTVAIDKLLRKGYVNRYKDENDRRVVRIELTKKGKLAFRLHQKFHKLMVERITQSLDDKEKEIIMRSLSNVSELIDELDARYLHNLKKAEKRLRSKEVK